MYRLFLSLFLASIVLGELCTEPQRGLFMSYETLSKSDEVQKAFEKMNQSMSIMENQYYDANLKANFSLTNIKFQLKYNIDGQKAQYYDKFTLHVSMGTLELSSQLNYSIKYNGKAKAGNIQIKIKVDPSYFIKRLVMTNACLEWRLKEYSALTLFQSCSLEYIYPTVTYQQYAVFLKMVNNEAGSHRIKDQAQVEMNSKYGPLLTQYIESNPFSNSSMTYKYEDIIIQLDNYIKEYNFSEEENKGLKSFFIFGSERAVQNCTQLPQQFDEKQYGGLQEIYTFSQVEAIIKEAIFMGLCDKEIDKNWDVPTFHFKMGDLAKLVPYAKKANPTDEFGASCRLNRSRINQLKAMKYDEEEIIVPVPISCFVHYRGKDIIQLDTIIRFLAHLKGEPEHVSVTISQVRLYELYWSAINKNYQISSTYDAANAISEVLMGLKGKSTFGNYFPTAKRTSSVVKIFDDRVLVYEPLQWKA